MLIDTHAHLWWDSYSDDLEKVLERARDSGVEKIIIPGTNFETSLAAINLANKYPINLYAAVGIHPEDLKGALVEQIEKLIRENREQIVAVGEIGTDKSTDELRNSIGEQSEYLKNQCELAIKYDLPVIIHTRDSLEETLMVIDHLPQTPKGQFHCFSHDEEGVKAVIERGFYVSFCGNITWSKRVAKLVKQVPDDRLLLETDSPFMAAGARNEPNYVAVLAEKIAELRGQSFDQIAQLTSINAKTLFNL